MPKYHKPNDLKSPYWDSNAAAKQCKLNVRRAGFRSTLRKLALFHTSYVSSTGHKSIGAGTSRILSKTKAKSERRQRRETFSEEKLAAIGELLSSLK